MTDEQDIFSPEELQNPFDAIIAVGHQSAATRLIRKVLADTRQNHPLRF